jgi:hypothetical protein
MKFKGLVDEGRDSACPPKTAPALNAIITKHFIGVIASGGSHSGGGGTPVSVYLVIELFYSEPKNHNHRHFHPLLPGIIWTGPEMV